MKWEVEYSDEFAVWWESLNEDEQESMVVVISLLEERGPNLPFPYSSGVSASRHSRMRELRIQHRGEPYRILYVFDPRRAALLLIGGKKTGDKHWYETFVPIADRIYDSHLRELSKQR